MRPAHIHFQVSGRQDKIVTQIMGYAQLNEGHIEKLNLAHELSLARDFVENLRSTSRALVGYVELPGAGHGFDMTDGARTGSMATAIGLFLNEVHRKRTMVGAKQVI